MSANHALSHASIFREYDIRGVVGKTLHASDAYAIGRAFGSVIAAKNPKARICVGYDGRLSSPELKDALVKGLTECGHQVLHVGLGPTPMLYYAVCTQDADGGIMVTGSHNPPDHNGFKFMLGRKPFFGEAIRALRDIIAKADYATAQGGSVYELDIKEEYLTALTRAYIPGRSLSIGWDAGNGAAGDIMDALCRRLPGTHHTLNAGIDGTFPAHHPDPTVPENLEQLIALVREKKLDAGIAFDGDGDRIGVVDDEGEILWGDQLLMLYSTEILRSQPGATIIADVKASQLLFDEVARLGGKPLMWKTGHSHIKAKMAETNAPLAGEMSGHIFFADSYFGFDDGIYAGVRFLNLLAASDMKLSEWRKKLPTLHSTPELRIDCPDERKFSLIDEAVARLTASGANFSNVDGMRVMTPDGWWLLRASNTQPIVVARCESATEDGLARLKASLASQLEQSGIEVNL